MDVGTILITIVAFGFMLYLVVYDYRSLRDGSHVDMKSVIVSVGVLGTFIGIFIGLYNFDTSNIEGSVPMLLEGLKFAFVTSIGGMTFSILLQTYQRRLVSGGDDELSVLAEINGKMGALNSIDAQLSGFRTEFRDELANVINSTTQGLNKLNETFKSNSQILEKMADKESLDRFRNEIHEEQVKSREFLTVQFGQTNKSLKEAIDVLSKGATEEIIEALNQVIKDFNNKLTEQFGKNFEELNGAVKDLVRWQENYKDIVEKDTALLSEIRMSMINTGESLETIAKRNAEIKEFYEDLRSLIHTYENQIDSVNKQLEVYSKMGREASDAFESMKNGFEKVQSGIGTQSETISELTTKISTQLPKTLGDLENTLVSLTERFGQDYQSFLDGYKKLVA